MSFNTEWIPGATFSGRALPDRAVDTSLADASAPRSTDGDSIASEEGSIASNDEAKIANDEATDNNTNDSAASLIDPHAVAFATGSSPPVYRLAALPLGYPENPIEIEDEDSANQPRNNEEVNDYERLNSPRFDPVEIVPFQTTVVDEEDVLHARERINRWFNNHIRHNSRRVLRGRSRRACTAAGPVEPYWTVNELMDSVLEDLDDVLNNVSCFELIHV
ncbi:uncharacterized protein PGTG_20396 [Puccinia graminis f. sp. tritici CRL 75-36-700-3]|uniref:Uncharacterized protein n=1 Tax=Puccinia graminis f. sp. tritici (strain CRL 75-36-700-3 / race SCCL) TaxID=418459 RepID=E3NXZ1_PUCGT|nr:uncharacterized protein PGTG_20396 [Puccinia graminis f. sp. tritici CRL 75-36-700-3]EFP94440.1 hypothetical protein PGTG_20396 [Puccinia graminis f. sp. tritici CRL 75-36-700-3]